MIDKVDSLGNELSKEQQEFFKDSQVVKGNKLLVCYHGTNINFRTFRNPINWFSIDKNYSNQFADFRSGTNQVIYKVYLNCKHLYDCGDTNGRVYGLIPTMESYQPNMKRIFDGLGLSDKECVDLVDRVVEEREKEGYVDDKTSYKYKLRVHIVTRTKVFGDLVKSKGYDGIMTKEEDGSVCFGVFNANDIKYVSNKNPTNSDNIDESLNKDVIDKVIEKFGTYNNVEDVANFKDFQFDKEEFNNLNNESQESSMNEDIEKHETLNPKLWNDDNTLKPEVREKILQIAKEFTDDLEKDGIKFKLDDIRLVGSNCSYNYNDKSDLDIHLIMNTESLECPDNLYPLLYSAYRSLFNRKLDIDFYGIPVEIYVEME